MICENNGGRESQLAYILDTENTYSRRVRLRRTKFTLDPDRIVIGIARPLPICYSFASVQVDTEQNKARAEPTKLRE